MPKKRSHHPSKTSRSGARTTSGTTSPLESLTQIRVELLEWAHDVESDSDAEELLSDITAMVTLAVERTGLRTLYGWNPGQVEEVMRAVLDDDALHLADDDPDAPYRVASSLAMLFDYLGESGRWRGRPATLERVQDVVEAILSEHDDDEFGQAHEEMLAVLAAVPVTDPPEALAAMRRLAVVGQVEGLLRWLGPSRPVTDATTLSPQDAADAAAAVGVDPGTSPGAAQDVGRVSVLWNHAVDAGLVDVTGTTARLTPQGQAWLDGAAEAYGEAAVLFALLNRVLFTPEADPLVPPPSLTLLPVLTSVLGGTTVTVAEANSMRDLFVRELSSAAADLEALPGDPETPAVLEALGHDTARPALGTLIEEGVVTVSGPDQQLGVAPGLESLVAAFLAHELLDDDEDEDEDDDDAPPPSWLA